MPESPRAWSRLRSVLATATARIAVAYALTACLIRDRCIGNVQPVIIPSSTRRAACLAAKNLRDREPLVLVGIDLIVQCPAGDPQLAGGGGAVPVVSSQALKD